MIIEFLSCTVSIVVPLLLQIYIADIDTKYQRYNIRQINTFCWLHECTDFLQNRSELLSNIET